MKSSSVIALALVLVCFGCNRDQNDKHKQALPSGHADETWKFWGSLNQAAVSGTGVEILRGAELNQRVKPTLLCAVLEDIIAGEQARSRTVTSLPVLNVDPDLTAYAVKYARSRTDLAVALQDLVTLLNKQEEITSGPVLGVGLLLNLLNHSDDKEDGILWRAMLDQAKQTTSDLQSLKEPARAVERSAVAACKVISELNTEEMSVRVKLSQRFGREFPPLTTYAKAAEAAKPKATRLTEKQIIQSLIGKQTGGLFGTWAFEDSKEFTSLQILSVTNQSGELAMYEVKTHVEGIRSGNERDFKLRLAYRWFYTRWVLLEIKQVE